MSISDYATDPEENNVPQPRLLEQVLDKDNLQRAAKRFKFKIREILSRRRGSAMSIRFKELREYVTGWFH